MLSTIEAFLKEYPLFYTLIASIALLISAILANFAVKRLLIRLLNHFIGKTAYGRDKELRGHGVIERLANIVPAFVISSGITLVPGLPAAIVTVVSNVANASVILSLTMAISAALNVTDTIYHRKPEAKLKPIKSYIQIVKIIIYAICAILMIATLIDRSPLILLSGLGAMAAVLILVFQDTLLSLVAGIQISSTDMVRVGDWIEMPGQNADGDVIEIALHTVKIQNFDKTITILPIRKLVTEPFRNWRGMQESGGRRIKRSIYLDQTSIRFLNQEEIDKFVGFHHLQSYLQRKQEELTEWNDKLGMLAKVEANTRRITNIGTFRAYVEAYLRSHPHVHQQMTLLVRQLEPGPEGLALEIYCFTNTTVWREYETIQADIFDHMFALLPEFGLSVFQNPSGADFQHLSKTGAVKTSTKLSANAALSSA
jgi:miniconductance mechanosensitive channel